jgi:hypothetical protein
MSSLNKKKKKNVNHLWRKAMPFRPGDLVEIVRVVTNQTKNWRNSWTSPMTQYVNNKQRYTIKSGCNNGMGYSLKEEPRFLWPETALVLVNTKETTKTPIERRIRKLWNESNWVKQNPTQAY